MFVWKMSEHFVALPGTPGLPAGTKNPAKNSVRQNEKNAAPLCTAQVHGVRLSSPWDCPSWKYAAVLMRPRLVDPDFGLDGAQSPFERLEDRVIGLTEYRGIHRQPGISIGSFVGI